MPTILADVPGGWSIYARDGLYRRQGRIDQIAALAASLRFNDAGSWTLQLGADDPKVALLDADLAGIEVRWEGFTAGPVFSGPVISRDHVWGADGDTITFGGATDEVWLARRFCFPDPTQYPDFTTHKWAVDYDSRTGHAETLMKQFVDVNLGPSALTSPQDRRLPLLSIPTTAGLGVSLTEQGRLQTLLALLQTIAAASGLGFFLTATPAGAVFDVFQPADRSVDVKLSSRDGNIAAYDSRTAAPAATVLHAGGQGDLALRVFSRSADTGLIAKYGLIEQFVDNTDAATVSVLTQRAVSQLNTSGPVVEANVTPLAGIASSGFLTSWNLGDAISIVTDADPVIDVVSGVQLVFGADGVTIDLDQTNRAVPASSVKVPPGAVKAPASVQKIRSLVRRIEGLEAH